MIIEDIKNKYCLDAIPNEAAIRKNNELFQKAKELAQEINMAEDKYYVVVKRVKSDLSKLLSPLDQNVKSEAQRIFKSWCRPKIKGI